MYVRTCMYVNTTCVCLVKHVAMTMWLFTEIGCPHYKICFSK